MGRYPPNCSRALVKKVYALLHHIVDGVPLQGTVDEFIQRRDCTRYPTAEKKLLEQRVLESFCQCTYTPLSTLVPLPSSVFPFDFDLRTESAETWSNLYAGQSPEFAGP